MPPRRWVRWLGALCVGVLLAGPAAAQERTGPGQIQGSIAAPRNRLPPAVTTQQTVELPGRTLHFAATAGSVMIPDAQGVPEAEIATVAYQLTGAEPGTRPVTFVFNGGPGSASAWLQLGAVGPWRVKMGGPGDDQSGVPSSAPELLANAETWLDFTDLVFIDPVGTGYSRFLATGEEVRKRLWSVSGDIASLAEVVRRWLEGAGRVGSPKYLLGESYGGFRAPRVAQALTQEEGIGVSGLILVSPELDAGGRSGAFDPLYWAEHLPSMAAVERARHGPVTRDGLVDVEAYAIGDYLHDELASGRDPAALQRMVDRVAGLTGVDPAVVRRERGTLQIGTFLTETAPGRVASTYDPTLSEPAAFDWNPFFRNPETIFARLSAPFSSAMLELYGHRLNWRPDALYRLGNNDVAREWDWGRGTVAPQSITALRLALAEDPRLHVLVAHGLFDLVTPYFASALMLDRLPEIPPAGRLTMVTFEGGHMFYSRDASRIGLRDEAKKLIERE